VSIDSANSRGGFTVYVDPDTIRHKGEIVKMWHLLDYKTMQPLLRGSFMSEKSQAQFDCAEERVRLLAITNFSGSMGSGNAIYTDIDEGKWGPVAPRSIAEALWEYACSKK
jgi:hypothetical protein